MNEVAFNPRTYRRNKSKIIAIWEATGIETDTIGSKEIDVINEESRERIDYDPFVVKTPERFSDNIRGVVIDQDLNGIDPSDEVLLKITIKDKIQIASKTIKILPYRAFKEKPQRVIICAWNEDKQAFVPLTCKSVGRDTVLLTKPIEKA